MTNAIQYLEAAKVDQVASELEAQGYQVIREPEGVDHDYDLVAIKNGKRIAIEVKARSLLRDSSEEIRRLREHALERGYDEFRLIVANPPREKVIEIEGLEQALMNYFAAKATPEELYDIASAPLIDSVDDVELDAVTISEQKFHVSGNGFINAKLEWGAGETRDGMTSNMSFPFSFDIVLNSNVEVEHVNNIIIDTSSFYE